MLHSLKAFLSSSESAPKLITDGRNEQASSSSSTCHPLCQCHSCRLKTNKFTSPSPHHNQSHSMSTLTKVTTNQLKESCMKLFKAPNSIKRDENGYTELHLASANGNVEKVACLCQEERVDLEERESGQKRTALHLACHRGHQEVILVLLAAGARINAVDKMGKTPLHITVEKNDFKCVQTLLYFGATDSNLCLNAMDVRGYCALHDAAKNNNESIIDLLLECGADAKMKTNRGHIPACLASSHPIREKLMGAFHKQLLITTQPTASGTLHESCSLQNFNSKTPLQRTGGRLHGYRKHSAGISSRNQLKAISSGARSRHQHHQLQSTSLRPYNLPSTKKCHCRQQCHYNLISPEVLLFDKAVSSRQSSTTEAIVNTPLQDQIQTLLIGTAEDNVTKVSRILDLCEDEDSDDEDTPIDYSRELCHPLCQCNQCLPIQNLMTREKSSTIHVNSSNQDGFTCLHVTAIHGHVKMTKWLLKQGANPKCQTNNLRTTAVHLAALYGNTEVLALLLEGRHGLKSDLDCQDSQGNSALHYASMKGNFLCANLLIHNKANLNVANWKGNTALHESCFHDHPDIVSLLLQNGVSLRVRNRQGLLPSNLTKSSEIYQIINKYNSGRLSDLSCCSSLDSTSLSLPSGSELPPANLSRNADIGESGVFSYLGDGSTICSNNMMDSMNHEKELEEELAADQALLDTIANFQRNSLLLFTEHSSQSSDKEDSGSLSSSRTNSSDNIDNSLEESLPMTLTPVRDVYRLSFIEDDNVSI